MVHYRAATPLLAMPGQGKTQNDMLLETPQSKLLTALEQALASAHTEKICTVLSDTVSESHAGMQSPG